MRTHIRIFLSLTILVISISATAQKATPLTQTQNITVNGNCGMCKKKIEAAAISKGATSAKWNEDTKLLQVQYRSGSTNADAIQSAIAAAGYDTEKYTATDSAYQHLPSCCQYERKPLATQTK